MRKDLLMLVVLVFLLLASRFDYLWNAELDRDLTQPTGMTTEATLSEVSSSVANEAPGETETDNGAGGKRMPVNHLLLMGLIGLLGSVLRENRVHVRFNRRRLKARQWRRIVNFGRNRLTSGIADLTASTTSDGFPNRRP